MPVPAHLRTPHAEPAGLGRNGIPCARAASGGASLRVPAGQQLRYRRQDGVRRALPVVGSALHPAGTTGPHRTCSRRGIAHCPPV